MAKSKTIRATPNLKKSLEELRAAVKTLPAGDLKKRADGAISYLSRTFKGEPQPLKGRYCPGGRPIIKEP